MLFSVSISILCFRKDPVLSCVHKSVEKCHYTYTTQFVPVTEEVVVKMIILLKIFRYQQLLSARCATRPTRSTVRSRTSRWGRTTRWCTATTPWCGTAWTRRRVARPGTAGSTRSRMWLATFYNIGYTVSRRPLARRAMWRRARASSWRTLRVRRCR